MMEDVELADGTTTVPSNDSANADGDNADDDDDDANKEEEGQQCSPIEQVVL